MPKIGEFPYKTIPAKIVRDDIGRMWGKENGSLIDLTGGGAGVVTMAGSPGRGVPPQTPETHGGDITGAGGGCPG